jgi:iron complex outermembrane receptor protein
VSAVFQYRVKDKQLTAGSGSINMNQLINAEKVTGQGLELDLQANLGGGFSGSLGYSYNDTEIKDQPVRAVLRQLRPTMPPAVAPRPIRPVRLQVRPDQRQPAAARAKRQPTSRSSTAPNGNGEFYAYTDWTYRSSYNFFLYEAPEYKAKPLTEGGVRRGLQMGRRQV